MTLIGVLYLLSVVFLCMWTFLLYRYWWKNKKTRAALGSIQSNLDAAIMECEFGFGHEMRKGVGFNPLATGFNPNSTIGVAQGGSRDVNNFRKCIEQNMMPSTNSITYNGLFYEYYFDTRTRKHSSGTDVSENKCNEESMLFYPTYCYAKTKKMSFGKDDSNNKNDFEYFMTVGLNSNIKQSDFKRKALNLVILLDISGSMKDSFYHLYHHLYQSSNTKMKAAKEAIMCIIKQLSSHDRLGIVTFESRAKTLQKLEFVNNIQMKKLKDTIESISAGGGTNFELGYNQVIGLYQEMKSVDKKYDNRIIILTDAQPNQGIRQSGYLLSLVTKYALEGVSRITNMDDNSSDYEADRFMELQYTHPIYTTFVGIGLDFNASLIEKISQSRGANYYTVKSTDDFNKKMEEEFEFMVTPLVFNVCLKLNCEGNSCEIDKVYGSSNSVVDNIMKTGEITRIHTLFPSKKSKTTGQTKGGVQLIKLKKNENDNNDINVELVVTFEDTNGKKYKNTQNVTFKAYENQHGKMICIQNDMIEFEEKEVNFYDNTGIRKAILLCKYVELMKSWIETDVNDNNSSLLVGEDYKGRLENFMNHFKSEMIQCDDDTLQQELDVMEKLVNLA